MIPSITEIVIPGGYSFYYDLEGQPATCLPGEQRKASPSWVAKPIAPNEASESVSSLFVFFSLSGLRKPGSANEFEPRFTTEQVEAIMAREVARTRMIADKLSVTIKKNFVSIMGGKRKQVIIAAWSTEGLFGRPLLTSLEDASRRDPIVAAHKATIKKLIEDGNYGEHQLS